MQDHDFIMVLGALSMLATMLLLLGVFAVFSWWPWWGGGVMIVLAGAGLAFGGAIGDP